MLRDIVLFVMLLSSFGVAKAQNPQPVTPITKCIVPFTFTATGTLFPSSAGFDNRQMACVNWNITYSNFGFSAVSLVVQSAPMGSNTTAGSFVTFAGTVVTGINPNTATTQAQTTFTGYYPWIRVTATLTGSGRLTGYLIGTQALSASGGGGGGGGGLCPGGSTTQMQYNNAGACGGTTNMTWNGSALTMPAGTSGATSLNWGASNLGFYKISTTRLGFPDNELQFQDTGTASRFFRIQANNMDIGQNIHAGSDITWYNASGVGSGNTVALLSDTNLLFGPFSGGALNTGIVRDNSDGVLNVANAGLTLQSVRFKTETPGTNSTLGATTAFVTAAVGTATTKTAFITAAECNNATAAPAYDLPTSNAPTATCFGTSYRFGALAYDNAADETASFYFPLPSGWTGNIDFTGYAFVNGTSQSFKLTIATVCIATSEDILNPTFNAAQTVTVTSPGTANQLFTFTQAAITTTGCAAGETLVVKVGRDTTDTSTATFNYTGTQIILRATPQA